MKNILIFLEENKLKPCGGPYGYNYNLKNGLDKIEMLMKNIYRIEITKKSGIYDKYLRKCIHIAKQVPFYRLKRPIGRLSVKEQIDIIKSIGVV